MHANPNLVGDIVPVDIVANLMCAVAYKTAKGGILSGRFLKLRNYESSLLKRNRFIHFIIISGSRPNNLQWLMKRQFYGNLNDNTVTILAIFDHCYIVKNIRTFMVKMKSAFWPWNGLIRRYNKIGSDRHSGFVNSNSWIEWQAIEIGIDPTLEGGTTATEGDSGLPMQFWAGKASALERLRGLYHGRIREVSLWEHSHVST